jgi:glycosyltransferase involved in cell wall biosynthesis
MVVRNAADLIRVNILHHLELGLERILILDNGSTDGTLEALGRLARGLPIEVGSDTGPYRQAQLTNRLVYEALQRGADWVLPIDADEFFVASTSLPQVVGASDAGALAIEVVNFVQRHRQRRPSVRGLLGMDHRPASTIPQGEARHHVEAGEWSMVEVAWHPKLAVRVSERTWIGIGAHEVRNPAGPVEATADVVCLHAPLRARSAIAERLEHARRLAEAEAAEDTGWQNRDLGRSEQEAEQLWRANSNRHGRLLVGGQPRGLVRDLRLRDAVAPHVPGPFRARVERATRRHRPGHSRVAATTLSGAPAADPDSDPLPAEHLARVEASRAALLEAVGTNADVTFVRGLGNLGDELIWAGARALLEGVAEREISIEELGGSSGEVAVLAGSGALCRPYHEWKPHAIAVAELRYERVVVLPSSVDVGEDSVCAALAATNAIVFARERDSLRAIDGLCDARLALDCAFYFDYGRFTGYSGNGTLNAFRTDAERRATSEPPNGNDDVTASAGSLDEWLHRIASAEAIRTDRAHVMIAGALLGKRVEYAPSSYHKLPAIAAWSLAGFPVAPIPDPTPPRAGPRPRPRRVAPVADAVCAVISTRDRPERAATALASVLRTPGAAAVVVDANSARERRDRLAAAIGDRAELLELDRNLGRGASRAAGIARANADTILLLDEDVELVPGALELLQRALADHPRAAAVSATLIGPEGSIEHSGGSCVRHGDLVQLELDGAGTPPTSSAAPASGPCDWAPHAAILVRATALAELPLAEDLAAFGEQEWALRASAAGIRVRRSAEARARLVERPRLEHAVPFAERMRRLELAAALARVRDRHGVVLADVFTVLPQLEDDVDRARILLSLLLADGAHAVLAAWDAGELAPLLGGRA